jgi:hypothetical protein
MIAFLALLSEMDQPKMIRFLGKDVPRSSVETALYSASTFLILFNLLAVPFALPKLRIFLGAPYVPSSSKAFGAVIENIPQLQRNGLRMADIGSGDGRLVLEASKRGMNALGVELNPWLVLVSRIRLLFNRSSSKILCRNAWKSMPKLVSFRPDLLTFYGRPGQGVMNRFGAFAEELSDKTGREIFVASNKFPIPGWNVRLIAQIEDFYVYKLHSNR